MGREIKKKCYYCKEQFDNCEQDIIVTNKESYPRLRIGITCHKKCADFTQRELQELDNLVETIKLITDISVIPPRFFVYLQDLRNGTNKIQGISTSKRKKGYRYKIIERAYMEYENSIKKGINKNNIEEVMQRLKYSYMVIVGKLDIVRNKMYDEYIKSKQQTNISTADENITFQVEKQDNKKYNWLEGDK